MKALDSTYSLQWESYCKLEDQKRVSKEGVGQTLATTSGLFVLRRSLLCLTGSEDTGPSQWGSHRQMVARTAPSVLARNCSVASSHLDRPGSKKLGLEPGTDTTYSACRGLLLPPRPWVPMAPQPFQIAQVALIQSRETGSEYQVPCLVPGLGPHLGGQGFDPTLLQSWKEMGM